MKIHLFVAAALLLLSAYSCNNLEQDRDITLDKDVLMDKIKGGWAGKAIGCTYGGPTEFRYSGMINDNIDIPWEKGYLEKTFKNCPGLYDDIYMDLTFVDVFDKCGPDARTEDFAMAFANAPYPLCEANQQARYNILHGIMPPESGHWKNNPHADDIDFQIEADYAGLMAPGMPNVAVALTDSIGHIMNYGDGWYGGVFVAAMYSYAFISDDPETIVSKALETIPEESKFHKCISDVIRWHEKYPDHWEINWSLCQKYWSYDIGCPKGVRADFNIDALLNSAYVAIGLLYGQGDFDRTVDIATRCGQDSDCNPSTAGGIIGTMLGYSGIPEKWMSDMPAIEDFKIIYTDISLNDAYRMSYEQALKIIERENGVIADKTVTVPYTSPRAVRLEQSFEGLWPKDVINLFKPIADLGELSFSGNGCVISHLMYCNDNSYIAEVDVVLDGKVIATSLLPADNHDRQQDVFFKYDMDSGEHTVSLVWKNPVDYASIDLTKAVIYENK